MGNGITRVEKRNAAWTQEVQGLRSVMEGGAKELHGLSWSVGQRIARVEKRNGA